MSVHSYEWVDPADGRRKRLKYGDILRLHWFRWLNERKAAGFPVLNSKPYWDECVMDWITTNFGPGPLDSRKNYSEQDEVGHALRSSICTCGSTSVGSPVHSKWCDLMNCEE